VAPGPPAYSKGMGCRPSAIRSSFEARTRFRPALWALSMRSFQSTQVFDLRAERWATYIWFSYVNTLRASVL